MKFILLLSSLFICVASFGVGPAASMQLLLPKAILPGQITPLEQVILNSQGDVIKDFSLSHEKFNHTIIVSQDLSNLVHIHPELQPNGHFKINLNDSLYDEDNLDASVAIPFPGTYFVISEVQPVGQSSTSVVTQSFSADGVAAPTALVLDPMIKGAVVKYFKGDSSIGTSGDVYKIRFTRQSMPGMIHFKFEIEEAMNHGGGVHYMPVEDLENWLGMKGHGILISEAGLTVQEKFFKHLHASGGHGSNNGGHGNHSGHKLAASSAGAALEFVMSGSTLPPQGIYKIWGQFKHRGQILTFPFVFEI